MKEKLTQLLQEGKDRIDAARSEGELQEVKGLLLGKQGALTGLLKELPRLDVSLRPDGQHRQVLRQLRPAAPGRAGGLDVRVRRGEQGQVLLRVRPPETGRHTEIQVRQMRLGAGRPDPPAEILPRVRRPV